MAARERIVFICGVLASCSGGAVSTDRPGPEVRIAELRHRFEGVIGPGAVSRFEPMDHRMRAVVEGDRRGARVELPMRASEAVLVEDQGSKLAVRFLLEGASDQISLATADGIAYYAGGLRGADIVHRVHATGTEDFVVFEQRPSRESLDYIVEVAGGLRLVSNVLEFVDDGGTPRLRVASPYVASSDGSRTSAALSVDGCAYDTNPAAPWGRPITRPGAESCEVHVRWKDVRYPAVVDPSWITTGHLNDGRGVHRSTPLGDGTVLITGGSVNASRPASAELFDGVGAFAMTGAMTTRRDGHTATRLPNGRVLVAGGYSGPGKDTLATAEVYENGTFTPIASTMSSGRSGHTATLLPSGKVLLAGGAKTRAPGEPLTYTATADLFDGTSFATTGALHDPRGDHTALLLPSGKVLIVGGGNNGANLSAAELYDAGAFALTGSLVVPRSEPTATLLSSNKVLVAGGGFGLDTEIFDGSTFTAGPNMLVHRRGHTATLLRSGKILFAGGLAAEPLATAELYDEATGFVPTASLLEARGAHNATLLDSGKVLIEGGLGLQSAELYALRQNGETCAMGDDCVSGICDPVGICCATTCSGSCRACAPLTGACVPVTGAPDLDTCEGTSACDPTGACVVNQICTSDANCFDGFYCDKSGRCAPRKARGAACNVATECMAPACRVCASAGGCVDGFCCNAGCGSPCLACDVSGHEGECTPVTGAPHQGRAPCLGDGSTCGQCDGKGDACVYLPAAAACKTACSAGSKTDSTCDGAGSCIAGPARACANHLACDETLGRCRSGCSADTDCATGFLCRGGACVQGGTTCTDGHVATTADGATRDCTPYRCESDGTCKVACSSVSDCVMPNVCGASGQCVAPEGATSTSSACAAPPARRGGGLGAPLLLGALLLASARRRRRPAVQPTVSSFENEYTASSSTNGSRVDSTPPRHQALRVRASTSS